MIRYECNKGEINTLVLTGAIDELSADIFTLIGLAYSSIASNDKDVADAFRNGIIKSMANEGMQKQLFDKTLPLPAGTINLSGKLSESESGNLLKKLDELCDLLKKANGNK